MVAKWLKKKILEGVMMLKRVLVSHSGESEMSHHEKSYGEASGQHSAGWAYFKTDLLTPDVSIQITAALANISLHLHERSWATPPS